MTLAKGLGGGVPIGAFLAKEKAAVFRAGRPRLYLWRQRPDLRRRIRVHQVYHRQRRTGPCQGMGEYLGHGLNWLKGNHEFITGVRGMGLIWAMEFNADIAASVYPASNEAGLLLGLLRPNSIRLMPPLTVSKSEIDEAVNRLRDGAHERRKPGTRVGITPRTPGPQRRRLHPDYAHSASGRSRRFRGAASPPHGDAK